MDKEMLRRYAAEFIGTFALVFFGCGTRDMVGDTHDFAGILVVHIAFALTIAAMIYTLSHISSAHFNPAITFGFALSGRFPWRYTLPYWIAEFAGALLAATLHFLIIPDKAAAAHYGATTPKEVGIIAALVVEIVFTFFLMLVSMASATDKRFKRADSGLTVGFTILVCGLAGNSLSGASMNPARSLAPAVFAGSTALTTLWLYFVGPLIGAALGAVVYEVIRSHKYTKDVLEEPPTDEEMIAQVKQEIRKETSTAR